MDYITNNAHLFRVPPWHLGGVVAWTAASWMGLASQGFNLHPQNRYQAPERLSSCSVPLILLSWTKVPPGTEIIGTKLRTWPFMMCMFMEKLWEAGVVIPICRAVYIQLWFKVNILIFDRRWFGTSLYPFPTECPTYLWWHGLGTVLSYWCGIIRGRKIIRGKDRINLMSRCDTGV